jgi:hypothetical protein
MIARNRVRCTVVAVPVSTEFGVSRGAIARDLLPWADPYVAQLIKKLQDEVRWERRMQAVLRQRSAGTSFSMPAEQSAPRGGEEE